MKRPQFIILISLFVILILFLTARIYPYYAFLTQTLAVSPVDLLFNKPQVKQDNERTNILILGKPDIDNDGPNLTDSIMLASYDHKQNALLTLGIPRDIWSSTMQDKINSAYAYGEDKKQGGGILLAKAEIEAVLNKPIHYTVIISFDKFQKLIDEVGGIEVEVENSFTDNSYPIKGKETDECFGDEDYECRYKTVSFKKGLTKMDGETALMFVRSRNAEGDEGSDFARSKRQQLVLTALKTKILQLAKDGDIKKLARLYTKTDELIIRDISNSEAAVLGKHIFLGPELQQFNLQIPHALFIVPDLSVYGRYVLIPADKEDFDNSIDCMYETMKVNGCYEETKALEKQ